MGSCLLKTTLIYFTCNQDLQLQPCYWQRCMKLYYFCLHIRKLNWIPHCPSVKWELLVFKWVAFHCYKTVEQEKMNLDNWSLGPKHPASLSSHLCHFMWPQLKLYLIQVTSHMFSCWYFFSRILFYECMNTFAQVYAHTYTTGTHMHTCIPTDKLTQRKRAEW